MNEVFTLRRTEYEVSVLPEATYDTSGDMLHVRCGAQAIDLPMSDAERLANDIRLAVRVWRNEEITA